MMFSVPDGETHVFQLKRHCGLLSRSQGHPLELLQLFWWLSGTLGEAQIQLHNPSSVDRTSIFDLDLDRVAFHCQIAVLERRVREPMTKWECWLNAMRGVPTVTDFEPLSVQRNAVFTWVLLLSKTDLVLNL